MELKRLKYFVTAAHEMSFSGAARKLGVSQPVLSRGIKELESHVGGELFTRSSTEISLTEAGKAFLPEADEALLTLDQAIMSVRQVIKGRDTKLDIAYLPILLDAFVGTTLESFRQTFPQVCLHPHEVAPQGQIDSLRSGSADVGIVCVYDCDSFEQEFDVFEICTMEMCVVLSSSHPLANAESVSLSQLDGTDYVNFMPSEFPNCSRAIGKYVRRNGIAYDPVIYANTMQSVMSSVIAGNSFGIMTILGKTIAPRSVSFVPLDPEDRFDVHFCGLVRKDESRKSVVAFLRECKRIADIRVPQLAQELRANPRVTTS